MVEDRRKKILSFIQEQPGIIKADVIRYMERNGSSIMTTHGIIIDLIKEGLIIERKDKPNSQVHHLYINDENQFNIVDKKITQVHNFIGSLYKKMKVAENDEKLDLFGDWFVEVVSNMLNVSPSLLFLVSQKTIHSERDRQILYSKIVNLMLEINTFIEQLNIIGITLSKMMDQLKDIRRWNEFHPDYIPINNNLKEIMLDFKKDINRHFYNQLSLDDIVYRSEHSSKR